MLASREQSWSVHSISRPKRAVELIYRSNSSDGDVPRLSGVGKRRPLPCKGISAQASYPSLRRSRPSWPTDHLMVLRSRLAFILTPMGDAGPWHSHLRTVPASHRFCRPASRPPPCATTRHARRDDTSCLSRSVWSNGKRFSGPVAQVSADRLESPVDKGEHSDV